MKKRLWSLLLALTLTLAMLAGCAEGGGSTARRDTPALVRTGGNRDLLAEAVSLSGYAESGLSGLESFGYGEGKFDDYLTVQANPLTATDYVLGIQKAARGLGGDGAGVASFGRYIREKTGFRCEPAEKYPVYNDLARALEAVYAAAGEACPDEVKKEATETVSRKAQRAIARWLSAAAAAYTLVAEQTGEIAEEHFAAVAAFTYTRCATTDTQDMMRLRYTAAEISEEAIQQAGAILTEATLRLMESLENFQVLTRKDTLTTIPTPLGNVMLGSSVEDEYESPEALLLLDPAGNDTYNGSVAASSSMKNCLSVAVDFAGDDIYSAGGEPSQGCGILGVGLLFDRQGQDTYTAMRLAQGCAIIGVGLLYDGEGDDSYHCSVTGQASALYGTAMLMDATGNDSYSGYGFVQASAGNRGVAYLVDGDGDDRYDTPVNTPAGYSRLDYGESHKGKNGGFSQGCGWGQRNIGDNGLAGGLAGMVDFGGADVYVGGLWVQGVGYWSGMGFVYNEGGDDEYRAYYYSQASVAHYGAGMVMDTDGNDVYNLTVGAGMAFVWDRGVALLVDDRGDDGYTCSGSHGGVANSYYDEKGVENQDLTYALFLEAQGDDVYYSSNRNELYGYGRGGYFLEAGGKDSYWNWAENDTTFSGRDDQKGGVFADTSRTEEEYPYFAFWEKAKKDAGFGKIK